jgi:hypothetical protein
VTGNLVRVGEFVLHSANYGQIMPGVKVIGVDVQNTAIQAFGVGKPMRIL